MTSRRVHSGTLEARELAASARVDDPEQAIRQHARALLDQCGNQLLPVQLNALFDWAGIRKVRSEEMPLEGALRRLPDGGFDILVREDAAPTRQRFSVAHELGHILFYRHATHAKALQAQRGPRAPQEEERLCNVAAEELLMPLAAIREVCRTADGTDRVFHLAQTCDVSVEAALIRLAPHWSGHGELQLWEHRAGSGWRATLTRRLGRSRTSLVDFDVEDWNAKVPESPALPWRATNRLYSRQKRMCLLARTTAASVSRRTPTLLISHELVKETGRKPRTELEHAGGERVRRAEVARALPTVAAPRVAEPAGSAKTQEATILRTV